jgi:hypothetical protein
LYYQLKSPPSPNGEGRGEVKKNRSIIAYSHFSEKECLLAIKLSNKQNTNSPLQMERGRG